jgi:hypothetical protein
MRGLLLRPSWFSVEVLLICWLFVIGLSLADSIDLSDELFLTPSVLQQAFEPESLEPAKSYLHAGKLLVTLEDQPAARRFYSVAHQPWMPGAPHDRYSLLFQRIRVYRI